MGTHTSCLIASASAAMLSMASVHAGILHVGNHGLDSATCGSDAQPCRSIGRAIEHAAAGDTILVGPGFYGDLNRDRDFSDPGDEAAVLNGLECMVCIDKRMRILSTHGASATRIDSSTVDFDTDDEEFPDTVRITANGVTFGAPGQGFELVGRSTIFLSSRGHGNVVVGGNVARRTDTPPLDVELGLIGGFLVTATGGPVHLHGNTAIGHHFGFSASGSVVLTDNVASDNTWHGFGVGGAGTQRLVGNFASANGAGPPAIDPGTNELVVPTGAGFRISGADVLAEDNISEGNFGPGFLLTLVTPANTLQRIRNNVAAGNAGAGVVIRTVGGAVGAANVRFNNIFGNLGAGTGCGLINESGKTVNAKGNFWGQASGPGADPADKAGPGSGCDQGPGSVTQVKPFATEIIPVVP
jgi:Right handed beta helix region